VLIVSRPGIPLAVRRRFWQLVAAGVATKQAAELVGVSATCGEGWFSDAGGMSPVSLHQPAGRYLSLAEREEIAIGRAAGQSMRRIAARIGRSPATVSRELARNRPLRHANRRCCRCCQYRATLAQAKAEARARRPKRSKLAGSPRLRAVVQAMLERRMSPEQISGRLPRLFPDDASMRISHEVIYQSLYIQGRGGLRRELTRCLRTGRALRKPRRRVDQRGRRRIPDMVMIADRPPEADDRAVPGHWEGDLLVGAESKSAIGTIVERATRFTLLLPLPAGHGAVQVAEAVTAAMADLPQRLRRSLTWDQGIEMAHHGQISTATDLAIYFCNPHSPWQRGTNENTNGLLRQYFPKGTNLAIHTAEHLDAVAAELNARPRKVLDYHTPAEALTRTLYTAASQPDQPTS
jgi:IS30 family transposase